MWNETSYGKLGDWLRGLVFSLFLESLPAFWGWGV